MRHQSERDAASDFPVAVDYETLHAVLLGALSFLAAGRPADSVADEALSRLRAAGLPVPPRPWVEPRVDDGPPFAPELADAPRHPEEPPW